MNAKRLLVIDDDAEIVDLVRRVAEGQGFEVATTSDPNDFMRLYGDFDPTVILLDVVMPEKDGIELLRGLAERDCACGILVMSGYNEYYTATAQSLSAALGLPQVRRLEKPIRLDALRTALDEAALWVRPAT